MKIWNKYCSAVERINKYGMYAASVCLIVMSLMITTEIICRNVFGFSTLISDEYSGYFCAAAVMFAGGYVFSKDGFIRVELLYGRFRGKTKWIIDLLCYITAIIFEFIVLYFCWKKVLYTATHGSTSVTVARTPLMIPQSVMVIGTLFLLLQLIAFFGNHIAGISGEKKEGGDAS